ncbi:MAG: DNA recombination protein RmuC [Nitriliruptoraceae bacterium]
MALTDVIVLVVAVVASAVAAAWLVEHRHRRAPRQPEALQTELDRMDRRLADAVDLVQRLDAQRAAQFGEVTEQLRAVSRSHIELRQTTGELKSALSSGPSRGQWGERMVADVLRAAGMVEGVNYRTQATTPAGTRPDVTFLLPHDRVVHMDVKFPLNRYLAMLQAESDEQRDRDRVAFLRAVRDRIAELDDRGYIDPAHGTIDCVLLFIPNDQIFQFVAEQQPELLDDALARGVVICAPTTLLAVLAVIRQATEQFALERTSDEILELLAAFRNQWERFTEAIDKVGRGLETTQRAYDALTTTRRAQLERHLDRIDELRRGDGTPRLRLASSDDRDRPDA